MANIEHLKIIKQGVEAWNEWRKNNPQVIPDLSGAKLIEANLIGAILRDTNLCGADLHGALLRSVDLTNSDLSGSILIDALLVTASLRNANLRSAHGEGANFWFSDLTYVDLSNAILNYANFTNANLTHANLFNTTLEGAILVRTNLKGATLKNCHVYGIGAWDVKLDDTEQEGLIITPFIERSVITVENLEIAQFIYLLLHNEKIRHIIDTITTKVVLILGRFIPNRKVILEAIRKKLRKHNYLPIIFDFEPPTSRDTLETVITLASLAKFVIADITSPKSIPQELVSIVKTLPSVPIQPLLMEGSRPWGMFDHIKKHPWVLAIHRYRDIDDLIASLEEKVIAPVEAKILELRNK